MAGRLRLRMVSPKTPILGPLLARRGGRRSRRPALALVCAHCRRADALWKVRVGARVDRHLCRVCGGITTDGGEALEVSLADGRLKPSSVAEDRSEPLPPVQALIELEGRAVAVAARLLPTCERRSLGAYVAGVRTELVRDRLRACVLLDVGEPICAGLPAGGTIVSLGLLAALRDEAQLAFVLAREIAIAELGLPARRLAAGLSGEGFLGRIRRAAGAGRLVEAVETSFAVGWGADVEMRADQRAVDRLVSAGYSPLGALDALRALEAASIEGRSGRFVVWDLRARALERRLSMEPPARAGRLNAEVYRRAVGGFAVFGC